MAELNQGSSQAGNSRKVRSKKLNAKVDLTAMVDLAFLLITFFMLTTSLSKPMAMDLAMPDKGESTKIDEKRTMTVLIGANNNAKYYMGKLSENTPKDIVIGNRELRKELAVRKKEVAAYTASIGKPQQGMIVLVKPAKNSNYGNLVDVLDELAISDVPTYAITEIAPAEIAVLSKPKLRE